MVTAPFGFLVLSPRALTRRLSRVLHCWDALLATVLLRVCGCKTQMYKPIYFPAHVFSELKVYFVQCDASLWVVFSSLCEV